MGLRASGQTLAYAVAGITIALAIGFPLGVIASGTIVSGSSRNRLLIIAGTRLFLGGIRAIHELV
ncbi:MAG: hypothetical protein ACE5Q6_26245, partial [Dehalococcoidia bacterium]